MPGVETEAGAGVATEAGAADRGTMGRVVQMYAADQTEPVRQPARSPRLLVMLGLAAVAALCLLAALHLKSAPAGPPAFQDLGAGISNATGLRGSLKTRWQGQGVQYQLEIKPIDPLQSAGFSYVAANPPGPLFLHIKLLDATGYAVCGKDVLFPYGPSSPGEAARERGQDVLQSALDENDKVASLSTQGTLACTPEQYKQADYWDFSTNFPSLAGQDALMRHAAELKARQEASKRAALERQKESRSGFYLEGDDQVMGYDAARGVLQSRLRNYLVTGAEQQAAASQWASNGVLFRYKCDQHSHCMLGRAGGAQVLSVTALQ